MVGPNEIARPRQLDGRFFLTIKMEFLHDYRRHPIVRKFTIS
jgi:hypothetical protein